MPGLLRGIARTTVIAGTATAVSNGVSRRQAGRWAAKEQQEQGQYTAVPQQYEPVAEAAAAAPVDMEAKLEQLRQLGELKAQGVLSEAEFLIQKDRILNS